MIKFLGGILISAVTCVSVAQEIEMPIPFSPGGHFSTLVPLTTAELNKQGWKTNVKFVGNCGSAKQTFNNSSKPVLTVWGSNWIDSAGNTCFIDVNANNFVDVYMQAPNYLCGPKNNANWSTQPGSIYTVAVTNSISKDELQALNAYRKKLGVAFKVIAYKNTGEVRTAYHAGEVDMILSSIGLEQQYTNQSKCLVTTGSAAIDGIQSIWTETGLKPGPVWVGFLILNPVGLTAEQTEKLKQDVRTTISTNTEIKSYMKNKHLLGYSGTVEQQLKLIKQ